MFSLSRAEHPFCITCRQHKVYKDYGAHSLAMVLQCDYVYTIGMLEDGTIEVSGEPSDLMSGSQFFRDMVGGFLNETYTMLES
jgi:hypothetical protein